MEKPSREYHSRSPPDGDRGQNCRQFKGIRMRKWGTWVSEIRMPKTREKIWLGSYKTAEQAARAYDAAVYYLRGPNSKAKFNFPDSVAAILSVSSLSRQQIQVAAAKYALQEIPSTSTSTSPKNNNSKVNEKPAMASQSLPSVVSQTDWSCDSPQIFNALDFGFSDSPFDDNGGPNLEKIPSIEEASVLEFIPTWQEEYIFFDTTDLWNFCDI